MKNLFSFDRTGKNTAASLDDNPFVTARLSDDLQAQMEAMDARLDTIMDGTSTDKKSGQATDSTERKKPFLVRHWRMWVSIVLMAVSFLLFQWAFQVGNGTLWIAIAGIVLLACAWFLISRENKRLRKGVTDFSSPDFESYSKDMDRLAEEARRELHIPEDSGEVEVLPFIYTRKKDTVKDCYPARTYDNLLLYAWCQGDSLCLSEGHTVLTIPKTAIVGYRYCDDSYTVDMWLKDEKCNEGRYKQYHIRQTGLLACRVKGYYKVEVRDDDMAGIGEKSKGAYEILIPCYDWPELEKLLHIEKID